MKKEVLDHGYVELVETWGSDEHIIEAARMSTAKGFQGWGDSTNPGDEKLLSYLWKNGHHSPFEMAGLVIEVQAPIMVFREWHRHRTQSYNELSARYTALPDLFYLPSPDRIRNGKQSSKNKQGSEGGYSDAEVDSTRQLIEDTYDQCRDIYESLLGFGLARELARLIVPVGQYSRMRASANLRNWLHFLSLRCHPTAQWEIREYANIVAGMVNEKFPRTAALWGKEMAGEFGG